MSNTVALAGIADDLTGALDAVVPCAAAGWRCVVATGPDHPTSALETGAQVVAISTNNHAIKYRHLSLP